MVGQMVCVVGGLGAVAGTRQRRARPRPEGRARSVGREPRRRCRAPAPGVVAGRGHRPVRRAARLAPAPRPAAGVLSTGWPAAGCAACAASGVRGLGLGRACAWAWRWGAWCAGAAWADRGAVRACASSMGTPLSAIRAANTVAARRHDRLRKVSQGAEKGGVHVVRHQDR